MALKEAFLDLHGIACAKNASIAAHLENSGGSNQWNLSFAKASNDREVDAFALLFKVLYSVRVKWRRQALMGPLQKRVVHC
jgi:hypothetical protein